MIGVSGDGGAQPLLAAADLVDQRQRVAVDVGEDQVRRRRTQVRESGVAGRGGVDLVAVGGQVVLQEGAGGLVLVGHEQSRRDVVGGAVHGSLRCWCSGLGCPGAGATASAAREGCHPGPVLRPDAATRGPERWRMGRSGP